MELITYNLTPSAPLDYICTDRFKKSRFSVVMSLPADKKNYAAGALLLPASMRGTEKFSDFAALCRRCDELYAADISDASSLRGGVSVVGLRAQMLDNKYSTEKEKSEGFDILDGVMELMSEILFRPLFKEENIENEKTNLINRIRAQINDPFGFALRRMREIMMEGEPGVILSEDAIDQIRSIKTNQLEKFREYLISAARVEFFYCGEEPHERVEALVKKHFAPLLTEREKIKAQSFKKCPDKPKYVDETGEYGQSNLLIGFRTPSLLDSPDFYAAELANEIFGEGPVSKLFLNLREKHSLCYFCGSGYDEINGVVTAGCGIAAGDRKKAEAEIFAQLTQLKKGKISDAELKAAKQAIFSDCLEAEDHPEDYEEFSRMARAFGGPRTIEEYKKGIAAVNPEQIAAAAEKYALDTVYFLRGTQNAEEGEE